MYKALINSYHVGAYVRWVQKCRQQLQLGNEIKNTDKTGKIWQNESARTLAFEPFQALYRTDLVSKQDPAWKWSRKLKLQELQWGQTKGRGTINRKIFLQRLGALSRPIRFRVRNSYSRVHNELQTDGKFWGSREQSILFWNILPFRKT